MGTGEGAPVAVATDELTFDPYDEATVRDPHALFRRMRAEAPLLHNEARSFFALSRFRDVEQALLDPVTYSSRYGVTLELLAGGIEIPPGTVILEDPPTHTIHRSLLSRMFTNRRVSQLEPTTRAMCAELLDPLVGEDGFDIVAEIGSIIPMRVISSLIGIPEQDQRAVRDHFRDARDNHSTDVLAGDIFADYIDWRIDHPSDDIMTQLLNAEFEDHEGTKRRLAREELLAYVNIVAAAGNETTNRLIGWGTQLLGDHPDQRRALVEDPALIPNAVEEILRFEPNTLMICRRVERDVDLHGTTVPAGSSMALLSTSANRDEERHEDADVFDVRRPRSQHFTFGFGTHYCLGQALARLEGRIVFEELLARFPDWDVDHGGAQFCFLPDMRGWDRLPVVVG
jgi:cytochrome P450